METQIRLRFGDVRKKSIVTENHFVSHMIEHIAWRMGLSIELTFVGSDWRGLGRTLGLEVTKLARRAAQEAATLGMIDDGSAVVLVSPERPGVQFFGAGEVNLKWFLSLRCEQVSSGQPLVELLEGLSEGLQLKIIVEVWTLEDPHHTWEGIYRALGISLSKIFGDDSELTKAQEQLQNDQVPELSPQIGALAVLERGVHRALVRRETAETNIQVIVNLQDTPGIELLREVDESILACTEEASVLLDGFAQAFGARLSIQFKATCLSSSHVYLEDIGLVLGRALLQILKLRMERYGANGAGSNVRNREDAEKKNVRVGVSVEGRKFWRFVPRDGDIKRLRETLLVGNTIGNALRSEDLDDFFDGLAGGMSGSIMVHLDEIRDASQTWTQIFAELGIALREAFAVNCSRRGVPPGVKATLV